MSDYRRGQALSAIAAAEERFRARDFPAAWMLALKARSLFPSLLGLHAAITAYDVLRRSAAAPKLPSGESEDWRDLLAFVGQSPDHDAVEARYRKLLALLTDPVRSKFASIAADEALKIVERAWREFKASQSQTSHLATTQTRSILQADNFVSKSLMREKKNMSSKSPSAKLEAVREDTAAIDLPSSSSEQKLTPSPNLSIHCREPTPLADIGNESAFSSSSSKPTMTTLCPRCGKWFRLAVLDTRLYLSCIGCWSDYSPRCDQCRELYKPKYVSGCYNLLVCGGPPVFFQLVTQPSRPRPLSPTPSEARGPIFL